MPRALPEALANRIPKQIVEAVQKAAKTYGVIGVCKFPSGAMLVAVSEPSVKRALESNT